MDFFGLLRSVRRERSGSHPNVHMTWQSRSLSRSMTWTHTFLKTQTWVWPIIAILVLATVGFFTKTMIESTVKGNLQTSLEHFVGIEAEMLMSWRAVQQSNAEALAATQAVRSVVYKMLADTPKEADGKSASELHAELSRILMPALDSHHYEGYMVFNRSQRILDATTPVLIGQERIPEFASVVKEAFDGKSAVSAPFASVVMLLDHDGVLRAGVPTMLVCTPIRDESFQVVGVLAFRIAPERDFMRMLQLGRPGATGESYAFNSKGVMVTGSRFDEQLILLGVLPDNERAKSILNVSLRDPGGDLTKGFRPTKRRASQPFTKMAESALAGNSGVDVDGYRGYRGVMVVGAWKWLPEFNIGVATEIDTSEAFRTLSILRYTFFTLFGLLAATSIGIFVFSLSAARMRREAQRSAMKAQQLGQYKLEEKLGAGAMGVVYRGHHSMLRRPAAVKMLELERMNDEALLRFEREVQITCQLNHPNTIAIYDYGRTPEGIFYYAMEYIEGINLQTLVTQYGPQPEERVIHILRQICGSLYEAHSMGLVHRDVKPANLMIARRGCEPDVVKVLDFGLVKAVSDEQGNDTRQSLTGTPLYMSPEAFQSPLTVDACSDLYAVGAVGYFLLTGKPVFEAESIASLCKKHIDEDPTPPSQRTAAPISEELEHAILACLEKKRPKRPQTARDLIGLLNRSPKAQAWTEEKGEAWWGRHERAEKAKSMGENPSTVSSALERTMEHNG